MKSARFLKLAIYTLSTVLVVLVLTVLQHFALAAAFLSVYAPIALFTVTGLDLCKSDPAKEAAFRLSCLNYRQGVYLDEYHFVRVAPIGQNPPPEASTPRPQGLSFTDRVLLYLFFAPFILPAHLYLLAANR